MYSDVKTLPDEQQICRKAKTRQAFLATEVANAKEKGVLLLLSCLHLKGSYDAGVGPFIFGARDGYACTDCNSAVCGLSPWGAVA